MKKILGTIFLILSVVILGFTQHEEEHHVPLDSTITNTVVDTLAMPDSTKKELNEIIYQFFSESDSGKVNLAIINVPPPVPVIKEEPKEDFLTKRPSHKFLVKSHDFVVGCLRHIDHTGVYAGRMSIAVFIKDSRTSRSLYPREEFN